jgi:agmatine deiminase
LWSNHPATDSTVARIAALVSANDKVIILYDTTIQGNLTALTQALTEMNAEFTNISYMHATAQSPWLRDFGPQISYFVNGTYVNRQIIDASYQNAPGSNEDILPQAIAPETGFEYSQMPLSFDFGNFLTDGIGRGYVSDKVMEQNPDLNEDQITEILYTSLGMNEIAILPSVPSAGGSQGEISRLVRFTDPETVLVSSFPESAACYNQVEQLAEILRNTVNDVGKYFNVLRLPVAPDENGFYPATMDDILQSYTSSIILNATILIPAYNQPQDSVAKQIYSEVFAGYQIVSVNSKMLASMQGSLLRLAVNIPQPELHRMRHSKLTGAIPFDNQVWINSFVYSIDCSDSISVYYRIHPDTNFIIYNTVGCCGGNSGLIENYQYTDTISYFIKAFDGVNSYSLPLNAPSSTYTFWFDGYVPVKKPVTNTICVFPNPAHQYIHIKPGIEKLENSLYELINLHGVTVQKGNVPNSLTIPIYEGTSEGIYVLKLTSFDKTHLTKVYLHN